MNRLVKMIAGLAGLFVVSTPAQAQTKWNLPTGYPPSNYHVENLMQFSKDVSEATNGSLQIVVHSNASLFKTPDIRRAVQTAQVQIGELPITQHENEDAIYGVDSLPFVATTFPNHRKLFEVSKEAIAKRVAAQGMFLLYGVPWPPHGIFAKKELNSVADMKGLRWRSATPAITRVGQLAGAQSVNITAVDLPQALATGTVNAFMTSAATGYDSKVWESLTHFYDTWAYFPNSTILVNKAAFDSLDPTQRQAVLKAGAAAEARGWAAAEERTQWYLDQLAAKGLKVSPPGPTLAAELRTIGDTMMQDWLKRAGPDGQAILDAYRAKVGQ